MPVEFHATTICAVKKNGTTAIAGDGQVTMGESVIFKNSALAHGDLSVARDSRFAVSFNGTNRCCVKFCHNNILFAEIPSVLFT